MPPRKKKKLTTRLFWWGALAGLIVGLFVVFLVKRPSPTPTLTFLIGVKPIQSGIEPSDDHQVTIWEVPGQLDQIKDEAAGELTLADGWQPPVLRQVHPPIWQIVRVKLPNGDFQFSRWVFLNAKDGQVRVERSLGPLGAPIPRGR